MNTKRLIGVIFLSVVFLMSGGIVILLSSQDSISPGFNEQWYECYKEPECPYHSSCEGNKVESGGLCHIICFTDKGTCTILKGEAYCGTGGGGSSDAPPEGWLSDWLYWLFTHIYLYCI